MIAVQIRRSDASIKRPLDVNAIQTLIAGNEVHVATQRTERPTTRIPVVASRLQWTTSSRNAQLTTPGRTNGQTGGLATTRLRWHASASSWMTPMSLAHYTLQQPTADLDSGLPNHRGPPKPSPAASLIRGRSGYRISSHVHNSSSHKSHHAFYTRKMSWIHVSFTVPCFTETTLFTQRTCCVR